MNTNPAVSTPVSEKIKQIAIAKRDILTLPSEKALSAILEFSQPAALVQSFSEGDFYFLVHDIGPDDALELLALASFDQWRYILDLEMWDRDRINNLPATRWLSRLFHADPNRFVYWFLHDGMDIVDFYLFKNVIVQAREHDQDPSDFGDGYETLDDSLYFNIFDSPQDDFSSDDRERKKQFLLQFFKQLSSWDHIVYQNKLFEFPAIMPAEFEEELYRLRNVRLAEKGFSVRDEAMGVYQPISSGRMDQYARRKPAKYESASPQALSLYSTGVMDPDTLFVRSLQAVETEDILAELQSEFASLCNQIVSADGAPVRNRDDLSKVVKKVCGYINIGLETAAGIWEQTPDNLAASFLKQYLLQAVFQLGYGRAVEIKQRAQKWKKGSWTEKNHLPLSFWSEERLGVLGGLLLKRPLYFDNYETGVLYREFESIADIEKTETTLNRIMACDRLLSYMDFDLNPEVSRLLAANGLLNEKNLILTLWARRSLNLEPVADYIDLSMFAGFFDALWEKEVAYPKIRDEAKEDFFLWIRESLPAGSRDDIDTLEPVFMDLFEEVENELGNIGGGDIEPKYVQLFLLKPTLNEP